MLRKLGGLRFVFKTLLSCPKEYTVNCISFYQRYDPIYIYNAMSQPAERAEPLTTEGTVQVLAGSLQPRK
jgi:hypothetical protein